MLLTFVKLPLLALLFLAPGWLLSLLVSPEDAKRSPWRFLLHTVLLSITINSLLIVSLLWGEAFSSALVLLLNGLLGIAAIGLTFLQRTRLPLKFSFSIQSLLLVIGCAFFMRVPASFHTAVFDDGGAYVNAAGVLLRHGSIFYPDNVLNSISAPDVRRNYQTNNLYFRAFQTDFSEQATYWADPQAGIKQPQFPALFSAWMAVFGDLLGLEQMVIVTSLFAVLAIVVLAALASDVTGSTRVATCTALLASFLPMSVFYGRYPVSEVPSQLFILSGLYFLTRLLYTADNRNSSSAKLTLIGAVLSYGAFFFTRISGFLHFPLFFALAVHVSNLPFGESARRRLNFFFAGIGLLWLASMSYYFRFNQPYIAYHLVELHGRIFGTHRALPHEVQFRQLALLLATVVLTAGLLRVTSRFLRQNNRWSHAYHLAVCWGGRLVFLLAVLFNAWCMWRLAYREIMIHGGVISTPSSESIRHANLYQLALHLSCGGLVLALVGSWVMLGRAYLSQYRCVTAFALLAFACYSLCFTRYTWYNFYYGRYLISEIVPQLTLATAIGANHLLTGTFGKLSKLAKALALLAILALIAESTPRLISQLTHPEEQHNSIHNYRSLLTLAPSAQQAIILLDRNYFEQEYQPEYPAMDSREANFNLMLFSTVVTPLRQIFGLKVALTSFPDPVAANYSADPSGVLLSANPNLATGSPFLTKLGRWPVSMNWFEKTPGFPTRYLSEPNYLILYAYQVDLISWRQAISTPD